MFYFRKLSQYLASSDGFTTDTSIPTCYDTVSTEARKVIEQGPF